MAMHVAIGAHIQVGVVIGTVYTVYKKVAWYYFVAHAIPFSPYRCAATLIERAMVFF